MQKILCSTLIDKRELLWEALCQVLGCAPVIEEESVPLQISFTKTSKIQLWWTWPREGITYSFSLAVLLGSLQTFIPFSVRCKHYKIHNSPVNSGFFQCFCLLPSTCLWICEGCPQCFPRRLSPSFLYEAHKPFFSTIKDPFKDFSNRFWNVMPPICPHLSLVIVTE